MHTFKTSFLILLFSFSLGFVAFAQNADTAPQTETLTLKVKGITCSGDLPIIIKNVEALAGVEKSEAVGEAKPTTTFTIIYQSDAVSREQIVQAVEESPSCDFPDQKPYRVKK